MSTPNRTALFATRGWLAPTQVDLIGDQLAYKNPWASAEARKQVRPSPKMLRAFVALERGQDIDILEFARTWGVLELCHHDRPCSHLPAFGEWPCVPMTVSEEADAYHEPTAIWRTLAAEARGIMDVSAKLQYSQPRAPEDWAPIRQAALTADTLVVARTGKFPKAWAPHERPLLGRDAEFDRAVLASVVTRSWLNDGDVRPRFDAETLRLVIEGDGLFGAIAVNLMLCVNGAKRLALCSGCGLPFEQTKPPSRGTRTYCEFCREAGIPHRDAARDSARIRRNNTTQK